MLATMVAAVQSARQGLVTPANLDVESRAASVVADIPNHIMRIAVVSDPKAGDGVV